MDGTNSNIYPIFQNIMPGRVDIILYEKKILVYYFKRFLEETNDIVQKL